MFISITIKKEFTIRKLPSLNYGNIQNVYFAHISKRIYNQTITLTNIREKTITLINIRGTYMLAYMAIDIDFDDNKPHVLNKQRFMNCAFTIRK